MESLVLLDIDRVIFDTNRFVRDVYEKVSKLNNAERVFERSRMPNGRLSMELLYRNIAEELGKDAAEEILFGGIERYRYGTEILKRIAEKYPLVFISTGSALQLRKLPEGFYAGVILTKSDEEKLEKLYALSKDVALYVDDKRSLVEEARSFGIRAYQAKWFLSEDYRRNAMNDALETMDDILKLLDI